MASADASHSSHKCRWYAETDPSFLPFFPSSVWLPTCPDQWQKGCADSCIRILSKKILEKKSLKFVEERAWLWPIAPIHLECQLKKQALDFSCNQRNHTTDLLENQSLQQEAVWATSASTLHQLVNKKSHQLMLVFSLIFLFQEWIPKAREFATFFRQEAAPPQNGRDFLCGRDWNPKLWWRWKLVWIWEFWSLDFFGWPSVFISVAQVWHWRQCKKAWLTQGMCSQLGI